MWEYYSFSATSRKENHESLIIAILLQREGKHYRSKRLVWPLGEKWEMNNVMEKREWYRLRDGEYVCKWFLVSVCLFVWVRERERERERKGKREKEMAGERGKTK